MSSGRAVDLRSVSDTLASANGRFGRIVGHQETGRRHGTNRQRARPIHSRFRTYNDLCSRLRPWRQNVNKVSTTVQLRFDVGQYRSLPDDVQRRLLALAGNRATQDGVLIITSRVHRTQEVNRAEARTRRNELIARAQVIPKTRRPSRPTVGSKVRRLTAKSQRSSSKKLRGRTSVRVGDQPDDYWAQVLCRPQSRLKT